MKASFSKLTKLNIARLLLVIVAFTFVITACSSDTETQTASTSNQPTATSAPSGTSTPRPTIAGGTAAPLPTVIGTDTTPKSAVTLTLGAYTTPREVYEKIVNPGFQKLWKERQNQDVRFQTSYLGSGAQARAIVGGFEADIAALSVATDITTIEKAGLIKHDWAGQSGAIFSRSIAVLAVRKGNPKGIKDWSDLAQPGLKILTPDPKTSGGAQWNIAAIWGAALRGKVTGVPANDTAAAQKFLTSVLKNVIAFDSSARASITNFENGLGDVAITYENEVITAIQAGNKSIEYVIPTSTIVIETPTAVIDTNVDKHRNRVVAEAFVRYLQSPEVQAAFAAGGYRPKDPAFLQQYATLYPPAADAWDITFLGGWPKVAVDLFAEGAVYQKALSAR